MSVFVGAAAVVEEECGPPSSHYDGVVTDTADGVNNPTRSTGIANNGTGTSSISRSLLSEAEASQLSAALVRLHSHNKILAYEHAKQQNELHAWKVRASEGGSLLAGGRASNREDRGEFYLHQEEQEDDIDNSISIPPLRSQSLGSTSQKSAKTRTKSTAPSASDHLPPTSTGDASDHGAATTTMDDSVVLWNQIDSSCLIQQSSSLQHSSAHHDNASTTTRPLADHRGSRPPTGLLGASYQFGGSSSSTSAQHHKSVTFREHQSPQKEVLDRWVGSKTTSEQGGDGLLLEDLQHPRTRGTPVDTASSRWTPADEDRDREHSHSSSPRNNYNTSVIKNKKLEELRESHQSMLEMQRAALLTLWSTWTCRNHARRLQRLAFRCWHQEACCASRNLKRIRKEAAEQMTQLKDRHRTEMKELAARSAQQTADVETAWRTETAIATAQQQDAYQGRALDIFNSLTLHLRSTSRTAVHGQLRQILSHWRNQAMARRHLLDLCHVNRQRDADRKLSKMLRLRPCFASWRHHAAKLRNSGRSVRNRDIESTNLSRRHLLGPVWRAWRSYFRRVQAFWTRYFFIRRHRKRELLPKVLHTWAGCVREERLNTEVTKLDEENKKLVADVEETKKLLTQVEEQESRRVQELVALEQQHRYIQQNNNNHITRTFIQTRPTSNNYTTMTILPGAQDHREKHQMTIPATSTLRLLARSDCDNVSIHPSEGEIFDLSRGGAAPIPSNFADNGTTIGQIAEATGRRTDSLLTPLMNRYGVFRPAEIEPALAGGATSEQQEMSPHSHVDQGDEVQHDDHDHVIQETLQTLHEDEANENEQGLLSVVSQDHHADREDADLHIRGHLHAHILSSTIDKMQRGLRLQAMAIAFRRLHHQKEKLAFRCNYGQMQIENFVSRKRFKDLRRTFEAFVAHQRRSGKFYALRFRALLRTQRQLFSGWRIGTVARREVAWNEAALQRRDTLAKEVEAFVISKQKLQEEKLARAVLHIWQSGNSELRTRCACFVRLIQRIIGEKQRQQTGNAFWTLKHSGIRQVVRDLEKSCCTLAGFDKLKNLVKMKNRAWMGAALLRLRACSFGTVVRRLDMSCQLEVKQIAQEKRKLEALLDSQQLAFREEQARTETEKTAVLATRIEELEKAVVSKTTELESLETESGLEIARLESSLSEAAAQRTALEYKHGEEKAILRRENETFKEQAQQQLQDLQLAIAEEKALLLQALESEKGRSAASIQDVEWQWHAEHERLVQEAHTAREESRRMQEEKESLLLKLEHQQETEASLRRSLEEYCNVQEVAHTRVTCESENLMHRVKALEKQLVEERKRFEQSQEVVLSQSQELCRMAQQQMLARSKPTKKASAGRGRSIGVPGSRVQSFRKPGEFHKGSAPPPPVVQQPGIVVVQKDVDQSALGIGMPQEERQHQQEPHQRSYVAPPLTSSVAPSNTTRVVAVSSGDPRSSSPVRKHQPVKQPPKPQVTSTAGTAPLSPPTTRRAANVYPPSRSRSVASSASRRRGGPLDAKRQRPRSFLSSGSSMVSSPSPKRNNSHSTSVSVGRRRANSSISPRKKAIVFDADSGRVEIASRRVSSTLRTRSGLDKGPYSRTSSQHNSPKKNLGQQVQALYGSSPLRNRTATLLAQSSKQRLEQQHKNFLTSTISSRAHQDHQQQNSGSLRQSRTSERSHSPFHMPKRHQAQEERPRSRGTRSRGDSGASNSTLLSSIHPLASMIGGRGAPDPRKGGPENKTTKGAGFLNSSLAIARSASNVGGGGNLVSTARGTSYRGPFRK
ncbi:unnamed protein product [Amoebophrya sp. A25]|nr:unnamed protein product [Amoebophrya sp. A25]|eukprot:GSA25T00017059001.1